MIVDSSAIMAIMLGEPEQAAMAYALFRAGSATISAGGWVELSAVLTRSGRPALFVLLEETMAQFLITIAPISIAQARIAHDAYRTFGIGSGHPARLNFGDCFAYALARETGESLLFKGDDFRHTGIAAAI